MGSSSILASAGIYDLGVPPVWIEWQADRQGWAPAWLAAWPCLVQRLQPQDLGQNQALALLAVGLGTLGQLAEVQGVWPAGEESQGPWDLRAGGFPLKSEAGSWGL